MSKERTRRPGVCTGQSMSSEKLSFAKHLRRNMTKAEKVFWEAVRHNRFMGYQFRRQQVIHGFIADFYCNDLNLIVEIDGGIHETQKDYDRLREEILKTHNFNVVRFTNEEVMASLDDVLERIRLKVEYYRSTINP